MALATPSTDNRRGSSREAVMLAGSAFGIARSRSVIISDLSSSGAQLDGRDLPTVGEDLVIVAGPFDTMAIVIWRTSEKSGIRFDTDVSEEMIARMKAEAKWSSIAGWYR